MSLKIFFRAIKTDIIQIIRDIHEIRHIGVLEAVLCSLECLIYI